MVNAEEILSKLNLAERDVCLGLELIIRSHYQLDMAEEALLRARKSIAEAKKKLVESQKLLEEGGVG